MLFRKARGEFSEGSGEAISGMGKDKMQPSVSKVSRKAETFLGVFSCTISSGSWTRLNTSGPGRARQPACSVICVGRCSN